MSDSATQTLDALRRLVPAVLADRLGRGEGLQTGECTVSILFVDVRNYASFAEERSAPEIFSFLSDYTRMVSGIVASRGGFLPEFSGDGLMAVFGAPTELRQMEAAAVAAGRDLERTMLALDLPVGLGIATGPAFVGCLPSADRLIWSVVGNAPILASRLQGLCRDLSASLVVDERTARAAGLGDEFVRYEGVPIRGRARRETLYALRRAREQIAREPAEALRAAS
jgi:adenylate cyclase